MNDLSTYVRALKNIEQAGFQFETKIVGKTLIVGQIRLRSRATPPSSPKEGLLLTNSSEKIRISLQKKGFSYLDTNGNMFLKFATHSVLIENATSQPKLRTKKNQTKISPTNLISPNGLALLDTLIRLETTELETFRSTLHFCKHFSLYQPKASQIMSRIGAKTLVELRKKLKLLPLEWWLFALDAPAARRKMAAFFEIGERYVSLNKDTNSLNTTQLMDQLNTYFLDDVAPGPLEVAKSWGKIQDENFSVWISPSKLDKIKRDFKLIPGSKEGHRSWIIATPAVSLERSELITHEPVSKKQLKTNKMRVIWDLGFGDSRLQEVRVDLLREVLDEL